MGQLFGTDGIRGLANTYPMDVETAMSAGRALASHFRHNDAARPVVLIGQDTRRSGDMIAQAVGAGICSAGMDICFLGIVPTPAVAFLTQVAGAVAGVVISASHNPFADNGIKLFNSNGYKLSDEEEEQIEALMSKDPHSLVDHIPSDGIGKINPVISSKAAYMDFLQSTVPGLFLANMKIVMDCANGATFQVAPTLFQRMGADIIPIFCEPDGININALCGSQHPETLAETVVKEKAALGLAFDGDGDRLIVVDEKGGVLSGDQIMAICANHLMSKGILKNQTVVSTIMSNIGFHQAMQRLGIRLVTTDVGDRYVMQDMHRKDAILGGEDSGHIIFRDRHTTGDGLLAALRLLDAMLSPGNSEPLSELAKIMTVFPQKLINVDVTSKPELSEIPEIMESIRSVEQTLGEDGRVLVRYSGTQSKCRVMVEGPTREETGELCRQIAAVISRRLN